MNKEEALKEFKEIIMKKSTFFKLLLDVLLTVATGGLWLIVIIIVDAVLLIKFLRINSR